MWELAIIVSLLGTAFFLVYLSSVMENKTFIHDALKILMIIAALFVVLMNAAIPIHIVENLNATGSSDNVTFSAGAIINVISTNVRVTQVTITVFMFLFFLWLILEIIQKGYINHMKRRGLE